MLKWAIIFFVISVVAGYFGFTGVASTTRTLAKVFFFIALAVFLIVLVFGVMLGHAGVLVQASLAASAARRCPAA